MLTPREQTVLRCRERGLTNKETAAALELSPHTIKHYVARILRKVGAQSCMEAVWKLRHRAPAAPAPEGKESL